MNFHPFGMTVNLQRVAVGVVVRRNEFHVMVRAKEFDHARELIWEIEIVVLGEIDKVAIFLLKQDLDLLCECRLISHSRQREKYQLLRLKILRKKPRVLLRAPVEKYPNLNPKISERFLKRP